ncbi:MAG: CopG family transcriptional regulator [Candidatus Omnitrophica bacterium]|nr:CopG family transcriptional regulator [Candidatus Omnitrophota bacterium]
MDKRLGFVGIIIEHRETCAEEVNKILSKFGDSIVARVGIPYRERHCSVITLVVDITLDDLGALTGKLGAVPGVTVKSGMAK